MQYKLGLTLTCAGAIALAGCGFDTTPEPAPDETTAESGIALTLDVSEMSDVETMRFNIQTCDGDEVASEEVNLSELDFDADMELEIEGPTAFADYFTTLTPGCYDVELEPLDADGEPSEDCPPTTASGVEVVAGETTEIVMVSQCGEEQHGAMDVLGVLNFAPAITLLEYDPSKILGCEAVTICATATDEDGDGIEFEWEQTGGPTPEEGPDVASYDFDDGTATECIEMTPLNTGAYSFQVRAYDLMEDDDGELVRVEDLADDFQSHSSLNFPLYVTCDEDPEDVLGEVEDPKKDKPEHEEDVLGEVEDDEKKKKDYPEEEDVLGEVEEEEEKTEKERKKKDYPEEVLGEVEEEEEKKKKDEEDVLGEVEEEEEKKKKDEPEEVLAEVEEEEEKKKKDEEEDVLGEVEEEEEEEKKKK
jgi:hypothetical protein